MTRFQIVASASVELASVVVVAALVEAAALPQAHAASHGAKHQQYCTADAEPHSWCMNFEQVEPCRLDDLCVVVLHVVLLREAGAHLVVVVVVCGRLGVCCGDAKRC